MCYNFSNDDINYFLDHSTCNTTKQKKYLFRQNQTPDKFYIVTNGGCYYPTGFLIDTEDKLAHTSCLSPVNVAGCHAIITSSDSHSFEAYVKESSAYYTFPKSALDTLKTKNPTLHNKMTALLKENSSNALLATAKQKARRLQSSIIDNGKNVISLLGVISCFIIYIIFFRIEENLVNPSHTLQTAVIYVLLLIITAWTTYILKTNGRLLSNHGLTLKNTQQSLVDLFLFGAPMIIVLIALKYILTILPSSIYYKQPIFSLSFSPTYTIVACVFYFTSCLMQEYITRACLQTTLANILKPLGGNVWQALLIANLFFIIMHLHFSTLYACAAGVLGLFWGYMYLRTHNLIGVTLHHTIVSSIPFFLMDMGKALRAGSLFIQ